MRGVQRFSRKDHAQMAGVIPSDDCGMAVAVKNLMPITPPRFALARRRHVTLLRR
jgi:hypothetical protein